MRGESEAAKMLAEGWSVDGLPGHLVDDVPLTVEVVVLRHAHKMMDGEWRSWREPTGPIPATTHTVQLERDGVPLTRKDKLPGWAAGEREGWLARP